MPDSDARDAAPDGLASAFDRAFTGRPDGAWAAPGRVNLIGEHTDYNDGLVLPIALPQRTWVLARRREDDLVRLVSLDLPGEPVTVRLGEVGPGTPSGWAAYAAGSVWALPGAGGLDLAVASTVPIGAGLSSSAALEAAVAAAASDLFGLGLLADDAGRSQLAQACRRAENVVAQAPTGGMDQAASLRCRPAHALLLDCRDGAATQVPIDLAAHGLALLVINTRAEHALVDGQYGARRAQCEQAAAALGLPSLRSATLTQVAGLDELLARRARHVVSEIERVRAVVNALAAGDFDTVGRLFVASHASLRDDFEVSVRELDLAVEASLAAGALGARMTGGGFGGSAIALVRADQVEATAAAVEQAFAGNGLRAPECFVAVASAGAARVW